MPFQFTDPGVSLYREGAIFLGIDPDTGREVGVFTDRHLNCVGGPRTGKGSSIIVQNLRRLSSYNVLCIDPDGENLLASWQQRQAMGQKVRVLAPFDADKLVAQGLPPSMLASCNPLAEIDPNSPRARIQIRNLADALVMRYRADDGMWDNGGVSILSGVLAHVIANAPPEERTLPEARRLIGQTDEELAKDFATMAKDSRLSGLMKTAATIGLSKSKKNQEYVGNARDNTEWLDDAAYAALFANPNFRLSDLKTSKTDVFLVLPSGSLKTEGRFLRLFVTAALHAMMEGGKDGRKCLFILDEFYALGRLDIVLSASGLMPKFGVHLAIFLQYLTQCLELYGETGTHSFFGGSDADIFFGIKDKPGAEYISNRLGPLLPHEAVNQPPHYNPKTATWREQESAFVPPSPPPVLPQANAPAAVLGAFFGDPHARAVQRQARARTKYEARKELERAADENARRDYDHAMRMAGTPRLTPQDVAELTAKHTGDDVARAMIVFAKGNQVFKLKLAPYFRAGRSAAQAAPVASLASMFRNDGQQLPAAAPSYQNGSRSFLATSHKVVDTALGFIFAFAATAIVVKLLNPPVNKWLIVAPATAFFGVIINGLIDRYRATKAARGPLTVTVSNGDKE